MVLPIFTACANPYRSPSDGTPKCASSLSMVIHSTPALRGALLPLGPVLPVLGDVRIREDARHELGERAVLGTAEFAYRDARVGRWLTNLDLVARADVAFLDDAQVRTEAPREVELLDEGRVAHAHPELEAGQPG